MLTNCPVCNKEISNHSKKCMHCGANIKKIQKAKRYVAFFDEKKLISKSIIGLFVFIGLLLATILAYGVVTSNPQFLFNEDTKMLYEYIENDFSDRRFEDELNGGTLSVRYRRSFDTIITNHDVTLDIDYNFKSSLYEMDSANISFHADSDIDQIIINLKIKIDNENYSVTGSIYKPISNPKVSKVSLELYYSGFYENDVPALKAIIQEAISDIDEYFSANEVNTDLQSLIGQNRKNVSLVRSVYLTLEVLAFSWIGLIITNVLLIVLYKKRKKFLNS